MTPSLTPMVRAVREGEVVGARRQPDIIDDELAFALRE